MPRLAKEGVVGADAIFACLGPALEVFSRYARVEKASGETVTLKEFLEHVWAAVSKAVKMPTSFETAVRINYGSSPGPGGIPILTSLLGNPQFKNEVLIAYEMGYRTTVSNRLSIDLAIYYNDYSNQQTTEPATATANSTNKRPVVLV